MKKFLALFALTASFAVNAFTSGNVVFNGAAFLPQPVLTLSPGVGFVNLTTSVGGTSGTFLGNSLSLYSLSLPGFDNPVPSDNVFIQNALDGRLANFLTFTAPLVTNATTSAAVQVGVWSIVLGSGFDVVGGTPADLAVRNQALDWLEVTPTASTTWNAFSLNNKSYTEFVYATPVPEPTTLMMLALGVAVVCIATVKSRKRG